VVLDFVHHLEFYKLENTTFQKLSLLQSSGERRMTSTLLGPLEGFNLNNWTTFCFLIFRIPRRWTNYECHTPSSESLGSISEYVFPPSSEDEKRSSFRNIAFSSYLEFCTMDIINEISDFECKNVIS
jgi:hypothetical protein